MSHTMVMKRHIGGIVRVATPALRSGTRSYSILVPESFFSMKAHIFPAAERPQWSPDKVEEVVNELKGTSIQFMGSHEYDLISKPRLNVAGEFQYEQAHRIAATREFLDHATEAVEEAYDENSTELTLVELYDKLDEDHSHVTDNLDAKVESIQRLSDFAWENINLFLPKGPLKDVVRFYMPDEMTPQNLGRIKRTAQEWLPEEFRQQPGVDLQRFAAFQTPAVRKQMFDEIDAAAAEVKKSISSKHAKTELGKQIVQALDRAVKDAKYAIDPTHDITLDKINKTTDVQELRDLAHRVFHYNMDERLDRIYEKASTATGDLHAADKALKLSSATTPKAITQ